MSIYNIPLETIQGQAANTSDYDGKVLIVVNTASKCGFTPQYEGLEALYKKYQAQGLEILGFPSNQFGGQEPGDNTEVESFCQINYGVSFPLFAKTDVKGNDAHPLYKTLIHDAPFQGFNTEDQGGARFQGMFEQRMPEELKTDEVKWNFTKFLVNRQGQVVSRFESYATPESLTADIEKLL
ncbi:glutathione peroxidase [Paenibacillus selenitireducens]|uniref:Glutathione peroxidase n=1 Tax=Paenibacillus selenitireducens TaxID=1324314 RepID=A0A1T2X465_9BACL|nr:glutathione peroxidase [Paenibacillus selenitireducens]OPA74605.1 glutathione peroxidase [Paenibacillus selenitireducens]